MEKVKILVVDNDESLCHFLRLYLEAENYELLLAESAAEALELVREGPPSLALIDRILDFQFRSAPLLARRPDQVARKRVPARRPQALQSQEGAQPHVSTQDLDGLALARRLRHTYPSLPIILMTAHPTIDSAWEAGRLGVHYLTKPFAARELSRLLKTTLDAHPVQGSESLQAHQPAERKTKSPSSRRGERAKNK